MAAAPLQGLCEEATCSICLDYFQDPVITECGHNFCRACLARCWEGSAGGEVSCPQCRMKLQGNLIPNRQLVNLVEISRQLQLQGERSAEVKGGVCEKHQEPLKLFCKEDDAPICVVCEKSKEHRGHQVVPLEEAAQDYKDLLHCLLDLLKGEQVEILSQEAETKRESQELLTLKKAEMEKTKEQFRELISFLNEQEKLLLDQLEEVEKETARKRDEHLARLSEKFSSLGSLIVDMENKCQQSSSELLQDLKSIFQRWEEEQFHNDVTFPPWLKSKIQDVGDRNSFFAEKIKQFIDTLVAGPQTFSKAEIEQKEPLLQKAEGLSLPPSSALARQSPPIHPSTHLQKFFTRPRYGGKPDCSPPGQENSGSCPTKTLAPPLPPPPPASEFGESPQSQPSLAPFLQATRSLGSLRHRPPRWKDNGKVIPGANVTLDPDTAHPLLVLSEDGKRLRNEGRSQDLPDNPERFQFSPYVLGREGFTAGRHYWVVTVEREGHWAVGVARKSVRRKGFVDFVPEEGIWALRRGSDGYRASNLSEAVFLALGRRPRRIRVSLDYEMGQVAFNDADTSSHIYTFSLTSFSGETLLPFFGAWKKVSLVVSN